MATLDILNVGDRVRVNDNYPDDSSVGKVGTIANITVGHAYPLHVKLEDVSYSYVMKLDEVDKLPTFEVGDIVRILRSPYYHVIGSVGVVHSVGEDFVRAVISGDRENEGYPWTFYESELEILQPPAFEERFVTDLDNDEAYVSIRSDDYDPDKGQYVELNTGTLHLDADGALSLAEALTSAAKYIESVSRFEEIQGLLNPEPVEPDPVGLPGVYKVGDRVRIVGPPGGLKDAPGALNDVGKLGTVKSENDGYPYVEIDGGSSFYDNDNSVTGWFFPTASLLPAPIDLPGGYKVGDRVRILRGHYAGSLGTVTTLDEPPLDDSPRVPVNVDGSTLKGLQYATASIERYEEDAPKFSIGDRVVCTDRSVSGRNVIGNIGTVTLVDEEDETIDVTLDDPNEGFTILPYTAAIRII